MSLIAGPEGEPRVIKCLPSLFGNLGQAVKEGEVRYRVERSSVSGRRRFCVGFISLCVFCQRRENSGCSQLGIG